MPHKHPDLPIQAEITDINREFLRLLIHPQLRASPDGVLGLDRATLESLHRLSPAQLDQVAKAPLLLVEFRPLPVTHVYPRPAEQMVADAGIRTDWQQSLNDYANRLLIFIWQASRHNRLLCSFCLGLDRQQAQQLAQLSFVRLSRSGEYASAYLRARLYRHPRFWADLVHAARSGSPDQQLAAQLAVIQLSVADHQSINKDSFTRSYS
jgi:hypothetical protein